MTSRRVSRRRRRFNRAEHKELLIERAELVTRQLRHFLAFGRDLPRPMRAECEAMDQAFRDTMAPSGSAGPARPLGRPLSNSENAEHRRNQSATPGNAGFAQHEAVKDETKAVRGAWDPPCRAVREDVSGAMCDIVGRQSVGAQSPSRAKT